MSYIPSRYTQRICIGKTIKDVLYNKHSTETTLLFTDGTSLRLHPHYTVEHPIVRVGIITNGYDKNGDVIMVEDGD